MAQSDRPQDPPSGIGVVGAGSIGVAWSLVFARARRDVTLYDPDPGRRADAPGELLRRLRDLDVAGLLDEAADLIAARVQVTDELADAVGSVVYVQECAPEELALKRQLFAEMDALAPDAVVLASSSSALPISQVVEGLAGAGRCLVAHPGNPPYLLPIVEIVPAPFTRPSALETADALLSAVGMSPVVLHREVEGFVFNRLQGAVLREAYCLVRDGVVEPQDIDRVMREALGRRWSIIGPFETAELNTRGGIEAHARRLGPAYARMGAERGEDDPWTPDLVARVAAAVAHRFPRPLWEQSVEWRDRCLMALEAFRRRHPAFVTPRGDVPPGERPHGDG